MHYDAQRKLKTSFLWVFFILLVAYLGTYKLVTKDQKGLSAYTDAHVHYGASIGINPTKYERLDDPSIGRFGFAERGALETNTEIFIGRSTNLVIVAKPMYLSRVCNDSGFNKAHLRISSLHVLHNKVMLEDKPTEIRFRAFKGDRVRITVDNPSQRGCGGAFLRLYQENDFSHFPTLFFVAWALFGLALIYLNLPIHVAVLGAGLNLLLLYVHKQLGLSGFADLVYTSHLSALFCAAWLVIFTVFANKIARTVLSFALAVVALALPVIFLGHGFAFEALPTVDTFHAILQSHKNQIIEFWMKILGIKYILATLAVIIAVCFGLSQLAKAQVKRLPALAVALGLLLFGAANPWKFIDASPMIRMAASAVSSYFHELAAFQELEKQRTSNPDSIVANSNQRDTTMVVIIGESANKQHMSAYGYPRKTTPYADALISNGEMLRFDSAYSNHTYSNPTISRALTAASNYNGKPWVSEPSALAVANAADISTTWISNKLKFGPWDNVMSVIGDDAQETIHINSKVGKNLVSDRFDGALVPLLEQALKSRQNHKLIFIHLQGSHVDYAARYPRSHRIFGSKLNARKFGSALKTPNYSASVVNTYDNSIHYTDSVMKDVVELLKVQDNKVAMLYFSDHGENVFGRKSHNAARFEYDMAEIPLMLWANKAWQIAYQEKWRNLKANLGNVFTNDHIFDSVLGLNGIETIYAQAHNDLSSDKYSAVASPSTLHGNKALDTEQNGSFWFSSNVSEFAQQGAPRSAATANTLGHATQIASSKVDAVSLSIGLRQNKKTNDFVVLDDSGNELADITSALDMVSYHNAGEAILSVAKFDPQHSNDVITLIEQLVSDTRLKLTTLFDLQNIDTMNQLKGRVTSGLDLRATGDASSVINTVKQSNQPEILIALSEQNYYAIKPMENVLPSLIVDASASLSLQNKATKTELGAKVFWRDDRVKMVIVKYHSMFAN